MKRLKKYHLSTVYRSYSVELECIAKSYKEAAEKFEISLHHARNYCGVVETTEFHEGVVGHIMSGYIIFEYGRSDLNRKKMPYDELKKIIDEYVNKKILI